MFVLFIPQNVPQNRPKIDENQIYHKRKTPHIVVISAIQLQYMGLMELLAGLEPATC